MDIFKERISAYIWDIKYRFKQETSVEQTWRRIARAICAYEHVKAQPYWENKFYSVLENFQFLPGGRILAGSGTQREVTLFNCFVMPIAADNLPSIFTALKEGALTLQQGGGVGYDFSPLRPEGFAVKHSGAVASGPVSFMRIWNAMCATMLSTGERRGAMMGVLRCDHPDIETFIQAKETSSELRHFNVSVLVTDAFMQAVAEDKPWELIFPTDSGDDVDIVYRPWGISSKPLACKVIRRISARELWMKIIKAAYQYAEPGVIFIDTVNKQNNLWYREWISATNPCGEIPLPAYGACNLGALNLTQFVESPFTPQVKFNWTKLQEVTAIATRFLDNVINISRYPLSVQKEESLSTRRIGLGVTGLADVFVMLGLRYGEPESLKCATKIIQTLAYTTWETSIALAKERGPFPLYEEEKYLAGSFVQSLPEEMRSLIKKHGIRNSHHNAIAPTGTISLLANNVSHGIEPIFSGQYQRKVQALNGEPMAFTVTDYALRLWKATKNEAPFPSGWVDSNVLSPSAHLTMQAVMQKFVDQAISKTINLPVDFPFSKVANVYSEAYQLGLKGCTIFRPNPTTGQVLSLTDPACEDCRIDI